MDINVCPLFCKLFAHPGNKNRSNKSAGNSKHCNYTEQTLVFKNILCKIETAGIGIDHSCTAENSGNNDEQKLFVFEKELDIMTE